jgi:Domain of unknown function (DUF6378)
VRVEDLPSVRATEIVKDRAGKYGHPAEVYAIAAAFWEQVFGHPVTTHQVAECLHLVKHAREINGKYPVGFRDNRDDFAGYANVAQMIHDYEEADKSAADS